MSAVSSPFRHLSLTRIPFGGLSFAAYVGGRGAPLLLIHGSGPGASAIGNWRPVLDDLALDFHVMAIDLIGFGQSDRKAQAPYFDFEMWCEQAKVAVDALGADSVGVIGHSLAGAIALRLTAADKRVRSTLVTGSMGAGITANPHLRRVWTCPRSREEMRSLAQILLRNHEPITDEYLDARMAVIGNEAYRNYFDEMFAGPQEKFIEATKIPPSVLATIDTPVLMLHGRNDLPIPAEDAALPLLAALPKADLLLLHDCGHSIAMERRDTFLAAARSFFGASGAAH